MVYRQEKRVPKRWGWHTKLKKPSDLLSFTTMNEEPYNANKPWKKRQERLKTTKFNLTWYLEWYVGLTVVDLGESASELITSDLENYDSKGGEHVPGELWL